MSKSQQASTSKGLKRKTTEKDEFTEGQEYIRRQRALRQVEALKIGNFTVGRLGFQQRNRINYM